MKKVICDHAMKCPHGWNCSHGNPHKTTKNCKTECITFGAARCVEAPE